MARCPLDDYQVKPQNSPEVANFPLSQRFLPCNPWQKDFKHDARVYSVIVIHNAGFIPFGLLCLT
jgi:hypothetical protein